VSTISSGVITIKVAFTDCLKRLLARAVAATVLCSFVTAPTAVLAKDHDTDDNAGKHNKHQSKDDSAPETGAVPCISWVNPLVTPRLALLCVHGLGLYSGSYQAFGTQMARRGVATYAIDVRGFGSWMKSQGHSQVDMKACLTDVKSALEAIRQAHPGLPVFLLGESMGGAIALRVASLYPDLVEGVISSVPAGERFQQKKTDLKVAFEFLKGRHKQFDVGTKLVAQATQDQKLRDDWSSNPLDRMDLSPNELIQFQKFMNENHDAAKNITDDPVLFVQGTQDKLVKPEGTWELFNELTTPDKYFFAVPSEHLIFEEGQDKAADLARLTTMASNWMHMVGTRDGTIAQSKKNNWISEQTTEQPMDTHISDAIAKLIRGQNEQALPLMAAAVKANPASSDAHYWLGVTYARLHRTKDAHAQMLAALAIGSRAVVHAPQPSDDSIANAKDQAAAGSPDKTVVKIDPLARTLTNGKPAVVAFCAAWCEQCKPIDGFFAQVQNMLGNSANLLKVDVDDPSNAALVKLFNVGPIPTIIYLEKDGTVASETIGQTGFINFAKGISGIIR
jgi:acylglycerol lipase